MALPSKPNPPAATGPTATVTPMPRVPRRWVLAPRHLVVFGGSYLAVVTTCVVLIVRAATRA